MSVFLGGGAVVGYVGMASERLGVGGDSSMGGVSRDRAGRVGRGQRTSTFSGVPFSASN